MLIRGMSGFWFPDLIPVLDGAPFKPSFGLSGAFPNA